MIGICSLCLKVHYCEDVKSRDDCWTLSLQAAKMAMYMVCLAKFLHWVRTACILRTQRLGYSPKNTCHPSGSK